MGPSHIDMYDLKPDAPVEIRGEFKPIATNVPGIDISEQCPNKQRWMDKMAIVRSAYTIPTLVMAWISMDDDRWQPTLEVNDNIFPSCGSIVSKMLGPKESGPHLCLASKPSPVQQSGILGRSFNPFSAPNPIPTNLTFKFAILKLPGSVPLDR